MHSNRQNSRYILCIESIQLFETWQPEMYCTPLYAKLRPEIVFFMVFSNDMARMGGYFTLHTLLFAFIMQMMEFLIRKSLIKIMYL
jgi:hypothetical protein